MSDTPNASQELTKVCIDLPNHWWLKGESFWARPLGGDRYELQNVPFCAYGLNLGDVVRAVAASPERKPEVVEVLERSGNETLRVSFSVERDLQTPHIESIEALGAQAERANGTFVALNVPPDADLDALRDHLDQLEADGVLFYETCEERVPGSFDDRPEDGDATDEA